MATLGSFDYPDELLQDCNLSASDAREASDIIAAYAAKKLTGEKRVLLQSTASLLRYLAADTNEAMTAGNAEKVGG